MRLFAASETHPDPWPTVALAFIGRYPNRHAGHILSVDVLAREVTDRGTLKTTRLILKSGKIPMWAMALVGGSGVGAWVLEESEVNPFGPACYLRSTTRNINHGHLLSVHETTVLRPTAAAAPALSLMSTTPIDRGHSFVSTAAGPSLATATPPSSSAAPAVAAVGGSILPPSLTSSATEAGRSSSLKTGSSSSSRFSWPATWWPSSTTASSPSSSSSAANQPSGNRWSSPPPPDPYTDPSTSTPSSSAMTTTHETTAVITTDLHVSTYLRDKVEAFGESRFARGIERSRLGLREVIESVKRARELERRSATTTTTTGTTTRTVVERGVGWVGVG